MGHDQDENKQRGNWSSNTEYVLSLAGYAVGLGNMWRFPYLCYKNGGGAFLIPYLVMVTLVGIPLFFLESALGQFTSTGFLTLYNVAPMFRGIGYAKMLINLIASGYYGMVVAYPLVFIVYSFASSVPWASCDNPWNTAHCFTPQDRNASHKILGLSEGIGQPGSLVWSLVLASAIVWAVTFLSIFKGIKVLGKVVWFTATFPLVMLVVLFVRGVTLPGAGHGISYYIVPNFSKLGEPMVWCDAAVQVFFSLGTGWGTVTTMSSFSRFKNNCLRDALLVPLINSMASIFAGFVVFSVLGFLSIEMGTTISEVTTAGKTRLGLRHVPSSLRMLPMPTLWSVLFFLMLFFLGIDSTGGFYVLQLLDRYSVSLGLLTATICELVVFSYVYGAGHLMRDFEMMLGKELSSFWYCTWMVVTPLVLVCIFGSTFSMESYLSYQGYIYPAWAHVVGWGTAVFSLLAVPTYLIFYLLTTKDSFSQVRVRIKGGVAWCFLMVYYK
ncbi:Sodium- and chloride-dependent GABA transporter 2 [Chionoecetes opilio]|uniref:Transporter n=1 Tax=Chionoecetes opilio TaxID=41210 RepID=A0A8J4Y5S5_CHIOP|nr:Sodium- and chloride-dependent GABA transporter 2 [Chionoecetes opilio]